MQNAPVPAAFPATRQRLAQGYRQKESRGCGSSTLSKSASGEADEPIRMERSEGFGWQRLCLRLRFAAVQSLTRQLTLPTVDQVFGVPIPPVDAYYAQTTTLNVSWALFVIGMVVVCLALIDAVKTKSILPVAVAVSGTGCVISEAYCGVMGAVYWPTNLDNFAFAALGRQMSWYPVAAWFAFGAVSTYICYTMIRKKQKRFGCGWPLLLCAWPTSC